MQNTSKAIIMLSAIVLAIIYAPSEQPKSESTGYLEHLQEKLQKAVEQENYEEACRLRDKINSIQRA